MLWRRLEVRRDRRPGDLSASTLWRRLSDALKTKVGNLGKLREVAPTSSLDSGLGSSLHLGRGQCDMLPPGIFCLSYLVWVVVL
jgi:hypothetical protein